MFREWPATTRLAVGIACAAFFAHAAIMNLPFPFLPFMIQRFRPQEKENTAAYVGLVASAFFLGGGATSYLWGLAMDRHGRRPVVLVSLLGLACTTAAFGLSPSLWVAVLARLGSGAITSLPVATKAIIADVVPAKDQAQAMTFLTATWGTGMVVGPMLGGWLVSPHAASPGEEDHGLFAQPFVQAHPFSLPCLVVAGITAAIFLVAYWALPETLQDEDKNEDQQETSHTHQTKTLDSSKADQAPLLNQHGSNADAPESIDSVLIPIVNDRPVAPEVLNNVQKAAYNSQDVPSSGGLLSMFRAKNSRLTLLLYTAYSFASIGVEELHSIFCATQIARGGLGWTSANIGTSLAVIGLVLIVVQPLVYPLMERRLRIIGAFRVSCILVVLFTVLYPCTHIFATSYAGSGALVWPVFLVVSCTFKLFLGCCFTSMNLLLNNAVPMNLRGSINGLSMTAAQVVRMIAPLMGGLIFSWSVREPRAWPLNHHLAFLFFAASYASAWYIIQQLPASLNAPLQGGGARQTFALKFLDDDMEAAPPAYLPLRRDKAGLATIEAQR